MRSRRRPVTSPIYGLVANLPLLLLLAGIAYVVAVGVLHLEINSFGTELFIGNDATANRLEPIGGQTTAEMLQAALNSGDVEQMEAALNTLESSPQAGPGAAAPVG